MLLRWRIKLFLAVAIALLAPHASPRSLAVFLSTSSRPPHDLRRAAAPKNFGVSKRKSRRAVLASAACAVAVSSVRAAQAKYVSKGEWLNGIKRDPRAAEWWGKGGSMSPEAVQEAAKSLTPLQRYVLLLGGVEDDTDGRRFANGYDWDNTENGIYVSAISGVPLFSSDTKMQESWLGWPGFTKPINEKAILVRPDPRDGVSIEVLDRASMTHLGHIMSENHYCINAASMRFIPAGSLPKSSRNGDIFP